MFARRFSTSAGPIGVDFGARGVKMLQLRAAGDRLTVVGAARVDAPLTEWVAPKSTSSAGAAPGVAAPPKDHHVEPIRAASPPPSADPLLIEQLLTAMSAGGFHGRRCIVSLAREDVSVQSVRLPKMPDEELKQTAMWEASQRCGFDRNAMEVDFIRTGATLQSGENREEVILVAASHAAIHARLEPLLAIGLRPMAVDAGFAALVRTFSRQARREVDQSVVRAVVEIGFGGATILILRGDQIAFCKPVAIGGRHFNQAVAEHLQIDEKAAGDLRAARIAVQENERCKTSVDNGISGEGALAKPDAATDRAVYDAVRPLISNLVKEITLCLRYYGVTFRGHPPECVILTGGDGLEPHLADVMSKSCKTPVVFDDPLGTLGRMIGNIQSTMNRTPGSAACWAVAAGLALRGPAFKAARVERDVAAAGLRGAA